MAFDPVCGMRVNEGQTGFTSRYRGTTYYFCTEQCRAAFEKDPDQYVQRICPSGPQKRKVAIVGTGQVGATFAFALLNSGLVTDIVLIDMYAEKAEGHVMDLNHGLPFTQPASIWSGGYSECEDADIVVLTAGFPQKPGESRLNLAQRNVELFKDMIPRIVEHNPNFLLVVSNPLDVLTYVTLKVSGFPMNKVIGSGTALDSARFRYLLSSHCEVDPRNVHGFIIGEHGDSEVPVWSHVNIAGIPFKEYCPACRRDCRMGEREEIFGKVKNAAYDIIQKKGATYYAIALALVRIVEAILRDENSVLTVSTLIDGYYDIRDVCLSIPTVLNLNGVSRQLPIALDDDEVEKLRHSASVLKKILKGLGY